MNIYTVNIATITKAGLYDEVAVNRWPIVVIDDNEEALRKALQSEEVVNFIKSTIKTEYLYNYAKYYIHAVDYDTEEVVMKDCWMVKDINPGLF